MGNLFEDRVVRSHVWVHQENVGRYMRLRRLYAHVRGEPSIYASIYLVLTPTCDYELLSRNTREKERAICSLLKQTTYPADDHLPYYICGSY